MRVIIAQEVTDNSLPNGLAAWMVADWVLGQAKVYLPHLVVNRNVLALVLEKAPVDAAFVQFQEKGGLKTINREQAQKLVGGQR